MNKLVLKTSVWNLFKNYFYVLIYNCLSKRSLPLFTRGGDIISAGPNVIGCHEPQVTSAIIGFSQMGRSDFLIDVGANIGLISCICGNKFASVVMFEPNSLCLGVLSSNCSIALKDRQYEIRPYGLGRRKEKLDLRIPLKNWGGAFLETKDNSYGKSILISKDGFKEDDPKNYYSQTIEIESAELIFQDLFNNYAKLGRCKGTIKIDVEGFEMIILEAIAKMLPTHFEVSIIFENLGGGVSNILDAFGGRAKIYAIEKYPGNSSSRVAKAIKLIIKGRQEYRLQDWSEISQATDLVLDVSKQI